VSSIADLAVSLSLNSAKFTQGLKSAAVETKGFASALKGALSFALPAIGIGALAHGLKDAILDLESVGDGAAKAGLDLKEFMNIVGTMDADDTALATTAMVMLRKNLAEIAGGNKEMLANMKEVGLDPEIMALEGMDKALRRVAIAYTEASDPLRSFAIAQAALGKAAREAAPMLEEVAANSGRFNRFSGLSNRSMGEVARLKDDLLAWDNMRQGFKHALVRGAVELKHFVFASNEDWYKRWDTKGMDAEFNKSQEAAKARAKVMEEAAEQSAKMARSLESGLRALDLGATKWKDWVAGARQFANDFVAAKKAAGLEAFNQTRTPLESFKAELDRLDSLGRFGLDKDVIARARGQKFLDLERSLPNLDKSLEVFRAVAQTSNVLQRGSAEEAAFKARFEQQSMAAGMGGQGKGLNERLDEVFNRMADVEQQQLQELRRISEAMRGMPQFGVAGL
jgi:hypothetical protein